MAYKDSDELKADERYPLGDYSFRIERSSVPGSTNDKIEAICTQGGKNARKSIQVSSSTQLDGWYVEANGTEATVYATVKKPTGTDKSSELNTGMVQPIPIGSVAGHRYSVGAYSFDQFVTSQAVTGYITPSNYMVLFASGSPEGATITTIIHRADGTTEEDVQPADLSSTFINDNKTVYYGVTTLNVVTGWEHYGPTGNIKPNRTFSGADAWTMIYGSSSGAYETEEMIIGRFAIDLDDAGGVGPGSDWIDPGDYDPDWEEGDPTHTLYVTVTGALSGRHNDPIEDPSYSYIPADKDTVKDYGCGGDGGHGGGGGAGASTVVVHKFATNQANSKEVTAIARRHGYGSGGGKGGKGGDGCILVYY